MAGNCIWVDDCDDGPTVAKSAVRRAAKPHKCCECGDVIPKGSMYDFYSGLWEGVWSCYRTCARCSNLWTEYGNGGRVMGALVEYWQESFGFDYRDGIPKDFAPCGNKGGGRG